MAELKSDRSLKAVYVKGFDELMQKIEDINPDTKKLFQKELRKQIKPVEKLAKSFIPSEVSPAGEIQNLTIHLHGDGLLIKAIEAAPMAKQMSLDGNGHKRMLLQEYK